MKGELCGAIKSQKIAPVKKLLQSKADINESDGRFFPIHYALDSKPNVLVLIINAKSDLNQNDSEGRVTPLILAVSKQNLKSVKILVTQGADVNFALGNGFVSLHFAAHVGNPEIVEFLLTHGVNLNIRTLQGDSPLDIAASKAHNATVKLLLDANATIANNDPNLNSPLSIAASKGHEDTVKILLDAKADVFARNTQGNSALFLAASNNHCTVVNTLLEYGADVNCRNNNNNLPHDYAAHNGNYIMAKSLFEAGCYQAAIDAIWEVLYENKSHNIGDISNWTVKGRLPDTKFTEYALQLKNILLITSIRARHNTIPEGDSTLDIVNTFETLVAEAVKKLLNKNQTDAKEFAVNITSLVFDLFGIKNNTYLKRTMCTAIFAVTNKPITAFNQLRLEQKQPAISGGGGGGSKGPDNTAKTDTVIHKSMTSKGTTPYDRGALYIRVLKPESITKTILEPGNKKTIS